MWRVIVLLIVVLVLVATYFIVENWGEKVEINFYKLRYSSNLSIVVSIAFVGGVVLMMLISFINEMKLRNRIKSLKNKNQRFQEELNSLRNKSFENENYEE